VARRWVGQPLRRREDDRLLRGRGRFIGDVAIPGELHVVFVRSPYAHARIVAIDESRALALKGVVAVVTHKDVPDSPLPPFLWDTPPEKLVAALKPFLRPCHPPLLPPDRARYVGQALVAVVAENRYVAEDAAELVVVEYEPLEPLATVEAALAGDAPMVHDGWEDNIAVRFTVRKGDAKDALANAAVVVAERFSIQRQAGIPIEMRGAVADPDEDGSLTLWCSTQNAHPLRRAMSRVSGLAPERIRVIAPDVGGGFGIKGVLYPEDLLVGLIALRLGRPVKWLEDRLEHMQSAVHAREQVHELELGLSAEGEIVALRDFIRVDTGAYNPLGLVIPYNTIAHLMGPYRVPAFEAVAEGVITTKAPTAPYRGAGRPEAVFAFERALELGAHRLNLDSLEVRLRNLVRPEEMPFDTGILYRDGEPLVLDGGDYPELLRRAADRIGWDSGVRLADGRRVGRGIAMYVEGTGIGPYEGAHVSLTADGRVLVRTGACSQGQGHATVLAQICADAMGVGPDDVDIIGGDTEGLERGWGTVASRSVVVAGSAVSEAAVTVKQQLLKLASGLLEIASADLTVEDGQVRAVGTARALTLAEIVAEAGRRGVVLEATRYHEPPTVTWSSGAHTARVAVDEETGVVEVLDYAVVHDCGRVVNPLVVEGQVIGGVAQGLAGALYEEVLYDEDGQLLNGTLVDYLVPTAEEVPTIRLDHLETPSPLNPLGLRGVGEGGAIAPPAVIANAVQDALPPGAGVVRRTPLSPPYVRELIGRQ